MNPIGLYIHVPFCVKKCGYCDFYSVVGNDNLMDMYTAAVCEKIKNYKGKVTADTLYFGGGTPSVIGGKRVAMMINAARDILTDNAEITVEANPADNLDDFFSRCRNAGVNRLSLGLQSANDNELSLLTRRHTRNDVAEAVSLAVKYGIDNISLDLMLGTEGQTKDSLLKSVDFCADMGANHVSAYMLKIEEGTPFATRKFETPLADDDEVSELYLSAIDRLAEKGYTQYEISNFAKDGAFSRHNLKYWNCDEYIGIGPSAHSFFEGERFYYDRDINGFICGNGTVFDGKGGDFEEYAMLRLRLCDGLRSDLVISRFENGNKLYDNILSRTEKLAHAGYLTANSEKIALTPKGFLISNSIICELI